MNQVIFPFKARRGARTPACRVETLSTPLAFALILAEIF
jgi:hypothetical protein